MKRIILSLAVTFAAIAVSAKTLVAYYSFTNNVHQIVEDLRTQIDADVVRIEPAEKGLDYAANGYEIGSALISAIRNNPDDASSYPAIDPVQIDMSQYDVVIIATPLWWSNMAAPMQTFLFNCGKEMSGKHIGLIVSSASSGISDVVADAKRLIPGGDFLGHDLWIRSSQVGNCHSMISKWLEEINYQSFISGIANLEADGAPASVSLYTLNGQRISDTTSPSVCRQAKNGCYIARIKRGGKYVAVKIIK